MAGVSPYHRALAYLALWLNTALVVISDLAVAALAAPPAVLPLLAHRPGAFRALAALLGAGYLCLAGAFWLVGGMAFAPAALLLLAVAALPPIATDPASRRARCRLSVKIGAASFTLLTALLMVQAAA